MQKFRLLSVEECLDEDYGVSIVQYQVGEMISFAFSNFSPEEIKNAPYIMQNELQEKNKRVGEQPHWASLSPKLLEAVLANPFDMHFVEYDADGWSDKAADDVWEEACKYDLGITRGEDDCFLTVYAGTMGDIDWRGHPEFGKPYLEQTISVFDALKEKVEAERKEFKEQYVSGQYETKRVYEDWYIIGFYESYTELLTCDYITEKGLEEEIRWLASLASPLGFLYEEWMGCDAAFSHDWDDMIDFICITYQEVVRDRNTLLPEKSNNVDISNEVMESLAERGGACLQKRAKDNMASLESQISLAEGHAHQQDLQGPVSEPER